MEDSGPGSSVGIATDYGLNGPGSNQSALSRETVRLCSRRVAPDSSGERESYVYATSTLYLDRLEIARFSLPRK